MGYFIFLILLWPLIIVAEHYNIAAAIFTPECGCNKTGIIILLWLLWSLLYVIIMGIISSYCNSWIYDNRKEIRKRLSAAGLDMHSGSGGFERTTQWITFATDKHVDDCLINAKARHSYFTKRYLLQYFRGQITESELLSKYNHNPLPRKCSFLSN